jgi:hypothetical protein
MARRFATVVLSRCADRHHRLSRQTRQNSARQRASAPLQSPAMGDADRPAIVIAWVDCKSCGRIEKATQDFNLPDDVATNMEL